MAQAPVWVTESGSLGVVPEGKFYRIALEAYDPDFPADPTKLTYTLIAGELPAGVQVNTNGTIEGIPVSVADFRGVPSEVSENVTSKFVIRVTDDDNPDRIADRTFTLTVTGQDKPEWTTPEGAIGSWSDSSEVSFQFEAVDLDPDDELTITLIAGELPSGLSLSSGGLLSGFADPLIPIGGVLPGFDRDDSEFEEFPFDFTTLAISQNYQFTLRLSDGKDVVLRTFEIFIVSRNLLTADSTEITVDTSHITADTIATRSPYITNNVDSIGTFRHDNYFAHKFNGSDPDGDQVNYYVSTGALPAGLTLDADTGWLSGFLPNIGLTEQEYNFGVKVFKVVTPANESLLYETSMTLVGDIIVAAEWLTDADLGTIDNGAYSTLSVEAVYESTTLQYRWTAGKLPQGLQIMPSGNIIGQVSFKTFSIDGGTTTFDEEHATRLGADPTTFDLTYTFTVEAYSATGVISIFKEFTILINGIYDTPYNTLYCKAMPPREDRTLIDSLLLNQDIISPDLLYRADDPNFGSARKVIYQHAFGLNPATIENYFAALELNHYNKNLVLGEIKTARALDADGNVEYEVVYSEIQDNLVNSAGESVAAALPIKYPAIDDGSSVSTVYPNSLANMGAQVIDQIGQVAKILPRWMLSKQEDGEVLGFTPAWVIAYTIPGKSKLLQYNIVDFFGTQLNLIDFEIDRYTLDSKLSEHWGITVDTTDITADSDHLVSDGRWEPGVATTFDRTNTTADNTQVTADDTDYTVDESAVTGEVPETIFDGGSTRFISPVDMYDSSDAKDTYIKFPQEKIINNIV